MTATKGVEDVRNGKFELHHFAGFARFGFFEAIAELRTEDIAADELLVPAQFDVGRVRIGIWEVAGINIDKFNDPIAVRPGSGNVERGLERAGQRKVFLQRSSFVDEDVSARGDKALIFEWIWLWITSGRISSIRNWFGRIAHVF